MKYNPQTGEMELISGPMTEGAEELTKGTSGDIQKELLATKNRTERLKNIFGKFNADFQTFGGKMKNKWIAGKEFAGFGLSNEERKYIDFLIAKTSQYSRTQNPQYDIFLHCTIPLEWEQRAPINIGITAGIETTIAPAEWVEGCGRMNLILCSSEHTIKVLKESKFEKRDQQTNQTVGIIEWKGDSEVIFEGADVEKYKVVKSTFDLSNVKEFTMTSFVEMIDGKPNPQYSLKEIVVNKGDRVRIKITVTSGMHDFKIDEYDVYADTQPNKESVVEFTVDKAGEFIYYCTKPGHRANGHWGTLKVLE